MLFCVCSKNSFSKYFWHKTIKDDKWLCALATASAHYSSGQGQQPATKKAHKFPPFPIFMTAVWTWKYDVHNTLRLASDGSSNITLPIAISIDLWQPHMTMCYFLNDFISSWHEKLQLLLRRHSFDGDVACLNQFTSSASFSLFFRNKKTIFRSERNSFARVF